VRYRGKPWKSLAQLAADVYQDDDRRNVSGTEWQTINEDGTRAFVICGTNGWRDWGYNLAAKRVEIPGLGWVHLGFFVAMQKCIRDFLLFTDDEPAALVGHSQGAAIAIELAVYVASVLRERRRVSCICALAPPRVGGEQFATMFGQHFDRTDARLYTRDFDLVTKFPRRGFDWRLPKFRHPTEPVELVSRLDLHHDHDVADYIDLIDE